MKTYKKIFLLGLLVFGHHLVTIAQAKEDEKIKIQFKVEGVCDMCKTTIENAAYIKGVKLAQWDKVSSIITVVYKTDKTNDDAIHQSIAAAGYDTDKVKATEKAYNSLPKCCKYREGLEKH